MYFLPLHKWVAQAHLYGMYAIVWSLLESYFNLWLRLFIQITFVNYELKLKIGSFPIIIEMEIILFYYYFEFRTFDWMVVAKYINYIIPKHIAQSTYIAELHLLHRNWYTTNARTFFARCKFKARDTNCFAVYRNSPLDGIIFRFSVSYLWFVFKVRIRWQRGTGVIKAVWCVPRISVCVHV